MNTRKLLRSGVAAFLLAAMPLATVHAVVSSGSSSATTTRLNTLKSKGTTEIDRRLSSLAAATDKITASTSLTAANKQALTDQQQAEVAALNALKTKLAAETTIASARADVASITSGYRVYALMLPKMRLVASANRFAIAQGKLTKLHETLQTAASQQKKAGKDITAIQRSLDDMKAKLDSAGSRTTDIVPKLLALQPTDYNADHAILVTYRAALKGAHADLATARDDARSAVTALKALK